MYVGVGPHVAETVADAMHGATYLDGLQTVRAFQLVVSPLGVVYVDLDSRSLLCPEEERSLLPTVGMGAVVGATSPD